MAPPLDRYTLRLLTRQAGQCPLCGEPLLTADQPPQSPEQWERWWLHVTRQAVAASYLVRHGRPGSPDGDQTRPPAFWSAPPRNVTEGAQDAGHMQGTGK